MIVTIDYVVISSHYHVVDYVGCFLDSTGHIAFTIQASWIMYFVLVPVSQICIAQSLDYSTLCAILIQLLLYGIYMSRFWIFCLQCLGIMDYNLENVVFLQNLNILCIIQQTDSINSNRSIYDRFITNFDSDSELSLDRFRVRFQFLKLCTQYPRHTQAPVSKSIVPVPVTTFPSNLYIYISCMIWGNENMYPIQ